MTIKDNPIDTTIDTQTFLCPLCTSSKMVEFEDTIYECQVCGETFQIIHYKDDE